MLKTAFIRTPYDQSRSQKKNSISNVVALIRKRMHSKSHSTTVFSHQTEREKKGK